MQRKKVSSKVKDPSLCDGLGYFVKNTPYTLHLSENSGVKQEVRSAVTGLGAADCSWHDFRRPNSVGDLQKGERYVSIQMV